MSRPMAPLDLIGLRVAELPLWLDARGNGVRMALPVGHEKFLAPGHLDGGLVLRVRDGKPPGTDNWRPIYHPGSWALWLDDRERYVFVTSKYSPPRRHVVVDGEFTAGEVIGEFAGGVNPEQALYPLRSLEIVLFANWLASYGDLILHASGVDLGDDGYCFAGHSGAGKSTVAAALASDASATVLGEDQVILRYLNGRFWIYGTPWHLDPDRCDPRGVPLHKLFFLDRTAEQGIAPCGPLEGVARLLQTAFVPYYRPEAVSGILDRLALLSGQVPFYTLNYRLGSDVVGLIGEASRPGADADRVPPAGVLGRVLPCNRVA